MHWTASLETTSFLESQLPRETEIDEVAVVGRSNVGKSSLINSLIGKKLAHVGSTPGKTRSINFYMVESATNFRFRLVDLPGYGYAARSKKERNDWSRLVSAYVENRRSLQLVCHLVDFRHGLLKNDRKLQEWLKNTGKKVLVVFTKADKMARGKQKELLRSYISEGLYSIGMPIITSADDWTGVDELRRFVNEFVQANDGM